MRRFNRMLALRLGVLNDNYLSSGRPLGEARLLFEIGPAGATVRELRLRMALDSGYLSRMLRILETEKLLIRRRDSQDGRVQRVELTPSGLQVWQELDQRSNERIDSLLTPLSDRQRGRLLMAVGEVERYLRAAALTIAPADPASPRRRPVFTLIFRSLHSALRKDLILLAPSPPSRRNSRRRRVISILPLWTAHRSAAGGENRRRWLW
ncbi:hypothetical protein SODG_006337 [Sodalis praecaptivus]